MKEIDDQFKEYFDVFLLDLDEISTLLKDLKRKLEAREVEEQEAMLTWRRKLETLGYSVRRNRQLIRWLTKKQHHVRDRVAK